MSNQVLKSWMMMMIFVMTMTMMMTMHQTVLVARRQPSSAQGFTQAAIHGLIKQNQFIMMMNMMMIMMVLMIGKVRSQMAVDTKRRDWSPLFPQCTIRFLVPSSHSKTGILRRQSCLPWIYIRKPQNTSNLCQLVFSKIDQATLKARPLSRTRNLLQYQRCLLYNLKDEMKVYHIT